MNAELVLDRMRAGVVALTGRAVGVEQEFGHEKERNALGSRWGVGQPRQHQMDDVVGEIVLAVGDEDLLSGDAIAAVGYALGLGAQRADVGAGLRLGQLHGAHPFARHELGQIGALELVAAMGHERVDAGHGEHGAEAKGHGCRVPHFDAGGVDGLRQILPAPLRRRGEPVPAGLRPGAVGLFPARRGGDDTVLEGRAVAVADRVEGRKHIGCELAGLLEHRLDHVVAEIAVEAIGQRRAETRGVPERKGDVVNRRPVGHRLVSGWERSAPVAAVGSLTLHH